MSLLKAITLFCVSSLKQNPYKSLLRLQVCQETAARDGLMKMKQVYEANPALGDPLSIQGQLTDNGQRLDRLRAELKKYQGYLDEAEGRGAPVVPGGGGGTSSGSAAGSSSQQHLSQRASAPAGSSAPSKSFFFPCGKL